VSSRHDLEQRSTLLTPNLTHDNIVGPLTECSLQQVELVDVAGVILSEGGTSDAGDPVSLGQFDLAGVLD